jgi:soluble lytic murein transglycosylase
MQGLKIVAVVGMVLGTALGSARAGDDATPRILSGADLKQAKSAFKAVAQRHWKSALRRADGVTEPLVGEIARYLYYTQPGAKAGFHDIVGLIGRHPDWPALDGLRRRAEELMPPTLAPSQVIAWFDADPPATGLGGQRLGEALIAAGREADGAAALRKAWIDGNFSRRDERAFLKRHKAVLDTDAHAARLDRLLWDGNRRAARRMLKRVDAAHKRLGTARLYLMEQHGGVDNAVARVPAELKNDPGLIYERVRWHRLKGFDERARELLFDPPAELGRPRKWWRERNIQVREAFDDGYVSDAYRLASKHGQTANGTVAEAEWLAGWIALRFLAEPRVALDHFTTMHGVVGYPISVARAAYWAGRAAAADGQPAAAEKWFRDAARHPTTFYGQLALAALGDEHLAFAPDPVAARSIVAAFEGRELTRVARILGELGEDKLMRRFARRLADVVTVPAEHALVAGLGADYGLHHVGLAAAKRSMRSGVTLADAAYPTPFDSSALKGIRNAPELALMLGVARQESEMNTRAISSAGARGLVQLLPATAKRMARTLRVKYSRARLTQDPDYNLRLGSVYLAGLLNRYNGAYALALAGYNAGPSRVKRWLRVNGDPRTGEVDPIDWIEMIPFHETRNYVQRVLENTQIYRHHLSDPNDRPKLRLVEDITGTPIRVAIR